MIDDDNRNRKRGALLCTENRRCECPILSGEGDRVKQSQL